MPIKELWARLVAGPEEAPIQPALRRLMLARIRSTASVPDTSARLDALAVVQNMSDREALNAAESYLKDSSIEVRRALAKAVRAAGSDGLPLLRRLAADPDADVATQALTQLLALGDRGASSRVRGQLAHPHPSVRATTAVYLGAFGGQSLLRLIKPLEHDPNDDVRAAAAWANDHIAGSSASPPLGLSMPSPADPPPKQSTSKAPSASPDDPIGDRLSALGRAESDPAALLDQLRAFPPAELQRALRKANPGGEPSRLRGSLRVARASAESRHAVWVRRLCNDERPAVRIAAAQAMGALAPASSLTWLTPLLRDPSTNVRLAAIEALGLAAVRVNDLDWARRALQPLLESDAQDVRLAAQHAIAQLDGPAATALLAPPDDSP